MNKLKQKIIEAVPEVMELKFGSRVRTITDRLPKTEGIFIDGSSSNGYAILSDDFGIFGNFSEKDLQILGRPITLADVLVALNKDDNIGFSLIVKNHQILIDNGKKIASMWDLSKNTLSQQSPECIKFLEKILL